MSWLTIFSDVNAVDYGAVCFDEGLAYSSSSDQAIRLSEAQLEEYRSLTGSVCLKLIRDNDLKIN